MPAGRRSHIAPAEVNRSAHNRFVGLVPSIVANTVMAPAETRCGPHRVVAVVTATPVIVEAPPAEER